MSPDPKLKKIILLSARIKQNILLSDLIRYEKLTGDKMGKDIKPIEGSENQEIFIETLERLYPAKIKMEEINNESQTEAIPCFGI